MSKKEKEETTQELVIKKRKPYAEAYKEIDLDLIEDLAANGATIVEIADSLGISKATLDRRKSELEAVEAAIRKGRARGLTEVQNQLMKLVKEGNLGASIFYLKARGGWRETSVQEIKANISTNNMNALSDDELHRIADSGGERTSESPEIPE